MNEATLSILKNIWLIISLTYPVCAIYAYLKLKRIKLSLHKSKHANRHYAEMLYASKDGYLTYSIFNKKEYQYCSRRLATMLSLKDGDKSTFLDVLDNFSKIDSDNLNLNFINLIKNGTNFEIIIKSSLQKTFVVSGSRINSADSTINSNCLWFKDITKEKSYIDEITKEARLCQDDLNNFRILIDYLPTPVWLRDSNLNITILNKPYLNLLGLKEFKQVTKNNINLSDLGNTTNFVDFAKTAKESNTLQKKLVNIIQNGDLRKFKLIETPYYDSSLKTSNTIGALIDVTSYHESKRNHQLNLTTHLEILGSLDTAFCIVDTKHQFTFSNFAFIKLWELSPDFTDSNPTYSHFLDTIRNQKIMPEVSDFKAYKEEENKALDSLTDQKEDLLYIPDGRTFKRIRAPHPNGTIIAYEDISDRLATTRHLNDLIANQQGILNNINEAILIISPNLKIKTFNTNFLKLWHLKEKSLENDLYLKDILDLQKKLLPELENWNSFKEDMTKHISASTAFILTLKNKQVIKVSSFILPDTSMMITYNKEQE